MSTGRCNGDDERIDSLEKTPGRVEGRQHTRTARLDQGPQRDFLQIAKGAACLGDELGGILRPSDLGV